MTRSVEDAEIKTNVLKQNSALLEVRGRVRRGSQASEKFGWSLGMGVSGAGRAERPELPGAQEGWTRLEVDWRTHRRSQKGLVGGTRVEPQEVKTYKRGARSAWWVGS